MLSDHDKEEIAKRRVRNHRRQLGLPPCDTPRERARRAPYSSYPRRFIHLGIDNVRELLARGRTAVWRARSVHGAAHAWGIKGYCPWMVGDLCYVFEPVIKHPRFGLLYSDNPNWAEFRRAHKALKGMPSYAIRLVVEVIDVERQGRKWLVRLQYRKDFVIPPAPDKP